MFNASWLSPHVGEVKTITFRSSDGIRNNPLMCGLGNYRDIFGKLWDIKAIIGKTVCARLVGDSSNSSYYSTSDNFYNDSDSSRCHSLIEKWPPYHVEIQKGECK